jgi:hypothetical protein
MSEWQPIETMPVGVVCMTAGKNKYGVIVPEIAIRFSMCGKDCFRLISNAPPYIDPTHWMPLPEPPK